MGSSPSAHPVDCVCRCSVGHVLGADGVHAVASLRNETFVAKHIILEMDNIFTSSSDLGGMDLKGLKVLEKPTGTLTILLHLARNRETTISVLIREVGMNQRTAYSALRKLLSLNLILVEVESSFPRTRKVYRLTDRGASLATLLKAADMMMKESPATATM